MELMTSDYVYVMYPVVTSQKMAETHEVVCCDGSGKLHQWNGIRKQLINYL